MTRVLGTVDFVGPSGGLISWGNLYLYATSKNLSAKSPGDWYGSGINVDLRSLYDLELISKSSNINLNAPNAISLNGDVSVDLTGLSITLASHDELNNYGNIDLDSSNVEITTLGSQVPTINGSGIGLASDIPLMARFYGKLDADQAIAGSMTPITWNSLIKSNITHTDGQDEIYLPNQGIYFINTFLTTNWNIGGHLLQIRLEHYNGATTQIKVIRPNPTVAALRNSIDVAYTVETTGPYDYVRIRAQTSADYILDGFVWIKDQCGINIVKL